MTHISLSVSRRGGVPNDTLAWKILFQGTCWGLAEEPDWGKKTSWYCHSAKFFFRPSLRGKWHNETPHHFFPSFLPQSGCNLSPLYRLDNSSSCPSLWANQYWNLLPAFTRWTVVTHQRAVVQQSASEVAVEAEGKDVAFSGAQSHFLVWTGSLERELCVIKAAAWIHREALTGLHGWRDTRLVAPRPGLINCHVHLVRQQSHTSEPYHSARPHGGRALWTPRSRDPPW